MQSSIKIVVQVHGGAQFFFDMFTGTTPPEARAVIQKILGKREKEQIFIGCSGNFTVDRLASNMGFEVFSNDVSLYSLLIADILLGRKSEVDVKNEELARVFDSWKPHRFKDFISVLFAIKISQFKNRANDYQQEMWNAYIENSQDYYLKTIEKFEKNKVFDFKIRDFFYGDFVEHIKGKQGSGIGVMFPPTYKGGYEKLFEFVDETFEYPKANYKMFDSKEAVSLYLDFLANDENIIYTDIEWPELEDFLQARVDYSGSKRDIFLYSSVKTGKKFYVSQRKKLKAAPKPLIDVDYSFSDRTEISVVPATPDEVNYYKAFFMSLKVDYSTGGDQGVLFLADGKVFGFAVFSKTLSDEENCFLHSDFVVNSHQKKLSKLVLYLLKSEEIRDLLIDKFKYYYEGLKTTVYTEKPVSMKYRGVFKLDRRDKGKLMYKTVFSGKTLNENYRAWRKRISQK